MTRRKKNPLTSRCSRALSPVRAPQVQLDPENDGPKIYAPADVDGCVRTTLRFPVTSVVEAFLGEEVSAAKSAFKTSTSHRLQLRGGDHSS